MFRTLTFFLLLTIVQSNNASYTYSTNWFEVPLDHFSYQRNVTFKIKYLVNDTYWDKKRGPIFFYTGNEGKIEFFAKYTGFMWEIAEEYQAKLVFAEHRYYGESMPFGNKSLDKEHIGYLTTSQALADYADLINFLQGNRIKPEFPVIVFGGSYGGMLAAYFRMKYPHLAAGAIAASAPVHQFTGMMPCNIFARNSTYTFNVTNEHCVENIRLSWPTLRNFTKQANSSEWLKKNWHLCDPRIDVHELIQSLSHIYESLAMVNYPFPSEFLLPLPAWPVRVACQHLNKPLKGEDLLKGIGKVIEMFISYEKNHKCLNFSKVSDNGNLGYEAWHYQICTEMVMPMGTTGIDDMFESSQWNYTSFAADCYKNFGVYPQLDAARILYGGDRLQAASNIVFSNGEFDPWSGGGILSNIGDKITAVVITEAAHHLDLMPANEADDPQSVRDARLIHKKKIKDWIDEFRRNQEIYV